MTVQHRDIPDAQLHEPKGVVSASANTLYLANGSGSGTWSKVNPVALSGVTDPGTDSNLRLITNGGGGFTLKRDAAYGSMAITANTNSMALTAATDASLNTNADYQLVSGTGAPWASDLLLDVTYASNQLTANTTGLYRLDLWMGITGFPAAGAKVAMKYRVNASTFSARHATMTGAATTSAGTMSMSCFVSLTAGNTVQVYVASTSAGSLTISDAQLNLNLIKAS
jgi:hypothetical protein